MAIAVTLILILALLTVLFFIGIPWRESKILVRFSRVGGIFGEQEEIIVYSDGKLFYTAEKRNISFEKELAPEVLSELKDKISKSSPYCGKVFEAGKGAADFYTYTLEVEKCKIVWVDEWAVQTPLPGEIVELQFFFKKLLEDF